MYAWVDTGQVGTPPQAATDERKAAILAKAEEINDWYLDSQGGARYRYRKPLLTLLAELSDLIAPRPGEEVKGGA